MVLTTRNVNPVVTRRRFAAGAALGAAAFALGPARLRFAAAQEAGDLASLGLPELNVTVNDTAYEGVPEELPAGRYLLTVTSKTTSAPGAISLFSPTPAGVSVDELMDAIAGMAGEQGGNGNDGGAESVPLFFYQMYYAGGTSAAPGATAQAVIDLKPGDYLGWPEGPEGQQQPVRLTATGDFPADAPEPESTITVTLLDFAIKFENEVKAGKHLMKVQNHGAQPHFVIIMKGPDTLTRQQVEASLQGEMTGSQSVDALPPDALIPVFMTPAQSIGVTTWHHVALEAGTYAAACFFPTAGTGVPHAMVGMTEIVKVTD